MDENLSNIMMIMYNYQLYMWEEGSELLFILSLNNVPPNFFVHSYFPQDHLSMARCTSSETDSEIK